MMIENYKKHDLHSELESLATESLLIDLFNQKQAEVFENIVFEGKKRFYVEDLRQRDYFLENTTPYQLKILNLVFNEHAWGNLLCKVSKELLERFPDYAIKIYDFRCQWSKQIMFSDEQRTNYKVVRDGVYINVNHTALHCCWFLQDLLDFFNIDKSSVVFLIHRPSGAEPKRVKEYIENRFKRNFASFIVERYAKSSDYAKNKVVVVIEKYLNPMLKKTSKSYDNFFLFDDNSTLSNYVKKVREQIAINIKFDEKTKMVLNKYLDYLVAFYKE